MVFLFRASRGDGWVHCGGSVGCLRFQVFLKNIIDGGSIEISAGRGGTAGTAEGGGSSMTSIQREPDGDGE